MWFWVLLTFFAVYESHGSNPLTTRNNFTFGNCSEKLDNFTITCSKKVNDLWNINDEKNINQLNVKDFCCSIWDYMFCIIEKARDEDICNEDNFKSLLNNSVILQNKLEENECSKHSRDRLFDCHFYWYYYLICFIGLIGVIAFIFMIISHLRRQQNQKKGRILKPQLF
jgi:hypothetical protein